MKIKNCPKCERKQQSGNYCLDCGTELVEIVTNDVKFNLIKKSNRTSDTLKKDIRRWLNRIGVQNPDITIGQRDGIAEVEYSLNNTTYHFSSFHQKTYQINLAAVEQFLHYRVLGIERGIETTEQAFKGYEALEYNSGYFGKCNTEEELKTEYKRLCKALHPDKGGVSEEFTKMQVEFNNWQQK